MNYTSEDSRIKWERIKAMVCAGVPVREASKREGVSENAINIRSTKGQWPTPSRIRRGLPPEAKKEHHAIVEARRQRQINEESIRLGAEALREKGEEGTIHAATTLLELLKKAKPEQIEKITDVSALATAINTLRKVTGLDKVDQNVSVNVSLFGGGTPSFRVLDEE